MTKKAIRIDDYGASSKYYEVYSKKFYGLTNFWFLKRLNSFKAWGPYPETTADEMYCLIEFLQYYNAKATLAVTASWVENDSSITPFPLKFPALAAAISYGVQAGIFEVASHGLTHCVLIEQAYKRVLILLIVLLIGNFGIGYHMKLIISIRQSKTILEDTSEFL